jgi:hypothetical protein
MSQDINDVAGSPAVVIPEDFAAYERYRKTGELPEAATADESDKKDDPETADAKKETSDEDDKTEQDETEEEKAAKSAKKSGWKRRQEKLEAAEQRAIEAERRAAELEARLAGKPAADSAKDAKPGSGDDAKPTRPKIDEFDSYEAFLAADAEYVDKLTDWKLDQREKKRAAEAERKAAESKQSTAVQAYTERAEKLRAKHADFDEALEEIEDVQFTKSFQAALVESEIGPEIAYHLAKNRAEAERLGKLSIDNPIAAIRELGKLEAKLAPSPAPAKPRISNAPEPPTPLQRGGKGAPRPLAEVTDFAEYERRRKAGERV